MRKSDTTIRFEEIMKVPEDPKWQAAIQMCQIVENRSYDDLNESNLYFDNQNFTDDNNLRRMSRTNRLNSQNITSLQTLSHLLDNKPWLKKY